MVNSVGNETEAVALLRTSVHHAQRDLLAHPPDGARVNQVLASLAAELAPGFPYLYAVADAHPLGPVATVLVDLRVAFAHAASGRSAPAVTSVAAAATNAFQLADDATPAALDGEVDGP